MTDKHYDLTNNGIQEMADDLCAIERKFVLKAVREVLETRRNESLYMGNAAVSDIMAAIEQRLGDNDKEV
jgi:hypothetical protein